MRTPSAEGCAVAALLFGLAAPASAAAAGLSWSAAVPLADARFSGVACPAENQCTTVTADSYEVTFNPAAPGVPAPVLIDPSGQVSAVACPSISQCTAVDEAGEEVTFDPAAPGTPPVAMIDPRSYSNAVVCPSVSMCVEVDSEYSEVTFNPASPGSGSPASVDAGGWSISSVACPDTNECVGVDQYGGEMAWDPSTPGFPPRYLIDPGGPTLDSVACVSANACIAVDNEGRSLTFDPLVASLPTILPLDPGRPLDAVTCVSSECVVVDGAGRVIAGNPADPRSWAMQQLVGASALTAISCPSLAECVTVDSAGNAYVGLSAPVDSTAPSITGQAALGQTLTETHGSWLGTPTSYAYRWQRCDTTGLTCAAIPGAAAQTYTVTGADAGSTIRVQETATNAIGTSGAATSGLSAPVTVPSSGGGGGSPPSSPPPPGDLVVIRFRVTDNGTVFTYTLSEPATVKIAITERLPGRRHRSRCAPPTKRLRHARPCTRIVSRRTLAHRSNQDATTLTTSRLKPGRYQATLTATTPTGHIARPQTITFTVQPT